MGVRIPLGELNDICYMIKFEYNGRVYKPSNLDKKLKALGITKDDITILEDIESKGEQRKAAFLDSITTKYNDRVYCFWDSYLKGWFNSLRPDLSDIVILDKNNLHLMGYTEPNESVEDAHKRLWKMVIKCDYGK